MNAPRDPATGRAILGGLARRAASWSRWAPVVTGFGERVHLVDLCGGRVWRTECGLEVRNTRPATAVAPLCRNCTGRAPQGAYPGVRR